MAASWIRRVWNRLCSEIVQDDPWEPGLAIGQIMLRAKTAEQFVPGRVLGVFNSPEELSAFIGCRPAAEFQDGYWITIRHLDGSYSSADRRHLWHLLASYEHHEPTISFEQAAKILTESVA